MGSAEDCSLLSQDELSVYALEPVFSIDAAGALTYQLPFLGGDYVPIGITDITPCSALSGRVTRLASRRADGV